jgi:uncharacterized metal-binding protein YceD (DUF177 family)
MVGTEHPWTVPIRVEDVPETGRRVDLTADESIRATLAEAARVNGVTRLEATFDVTRHGRSGLHVVGCIFATVQQTCIVTLEPISNEVVESVDLVFAPSAAQTNAGAVLLPEGKDPPEPMVDGMVDLGAIATEFLILGIDPYPRKPGAVFEAPQSGDGDASPFAALAALKKNDRGTER